jgi:hypothetical protein
MSGDDAAGQPEELSPRRQERQGPESGSSEFFLMLLGELGVLAREIS